MKITATPTHKPALGASAAAIGTTVSIEHPYDDLTADDLVSLFRCLMRAMGYAESTVEEYLGEE